MLPNASPRRVILSTRNKDQKRAEPINLMIKASQSRQSHDHSLELKSQSLMQQSPESSAYSKFIQKQDQRPSHQPSLEGASRYRIKPGVNNKIKFSINEQSKLDISRTKSFDNITEMDKTDETIPLPELKQSRELLPKILQNQMNDTMRD